MWRLTFFNPFSNPNGSLGQLLVQDEVNNTDGQITLSRKLRFYNMSDYIHLESSLVPVEFGLSIEKLMFQDSVKFLPTVTPLIDLPSMAMIKGHRSLCDYLMMGHKDVLCCGASTAIIARFLDEHALCNVVLVVT